MKPRYLINKDFPFNSWGMDKIVYPTKKQEIEFKKFPYYFEDITIQYKIILQIDSTIHSVMDLRTKIIYKIGDEVVYTTSHLNIYCKFIISGFCETENLDYIRVCWDSEQYNKDSWACGLGIISMYDPNKKYDKLVENLK